MNKPILLLLLLLPVLLTNCKESQTSDLSPEDAQMLEVLKEIKDNTKASDKELAHFISELHTTGKELQENGLLLKGESLISSFRNNVEANYHSQAISSSVVGSFALRFIEMLEDGHLEKTLFICRNIVAIQYDSRDWLDTYPLPDEYIKFTKKVEYRMKTDKELKKIIKQFESH